MKKEFEEYLNTIKVPKAFIERIEHLTPHVAAFCPEELQELFVTDYIQEDGTQEYESLFFFSANFVMEAKTFVTEENLDIAPLKDAIYYMSLKMQDYDLKQATEKSRANLMVYLREGPNISLVLKASKENCDYLTRMLETFFKPNLFQ